MKEYEILSKLKRLKPHFMELDEKRLCYLEMKWRIEQRMIDIHEKYAGPDQMWWMPKAKAEDITKLERLLKSRPYLTRVKFYFVPFFYL